MRERVLADTQREIDSAVTTRLATVFACVLAVTPCGSAADNPGDAEAVSPQTLEKVVSEQVRLELELQQEESAWQIQRGQLDALIALRKNEKERLEKTVSALTSREKTCQNERETLARKNTEARQLLSETETEAAQAAERLLTTYDNLPEPLLLKLKPSMQTIRTRLNASPSPEQTGERLRTVAAFGTDLQRTLSETHAVKQVVALDGGRRVEVESLYLGGLLGFYLEPDLRHAGLLSHTEKGWGAEPQDGIAAQVALALAITRKEAPPALVRLPLQAPMGQGGQRP